MGQGSDPLNQQPYGYDDVSPVDRAYVSSDAQSSDDVPYEVATREIEADIEQTRAEMSETINAIQERLNPQHLAEQAKEAVYDATIGNAIVTAKGFSFNMMETIKQNPLPAAIAVLSIGWLIRKSSGTDYNYYEEEHNRNPYSGRLHQPRYQAYNQGSQYNSQYYNDYDAGAYDAGAYANAGPNQSYADSSPGIGERVGEMAGNVKDQAQSVVSNVVDQAQNVAGNVVDQAQNVAGNVKDQAQSLASGVREQAHEVREQVEYYGEQAMERVEYAGDWVERQMRENPLAIGALVLAVGAAMGMSMPTTPVERRVLGPVRDNLVDKVQDAAQGTIEKVQDVAKQASQVVQEAGKEVAQTVQAAAKEVGQTAQQTAREVGQAAQQAAKPAGATPPASQGGQQTRSVGGPTAGASTPGISTPNKTPGATPGSSTGLPSGDKGRSNT